MIYGDLYIMLSRIIIKAKSVTCEIYPAYDKLERMSDSQSWDLTGSERRGLA